MNIPIKSICINVLFSTIALSTNFTIANDEVSLKAKPNIDDLAKNGIRFTDAHSSSSTCTPSRFSLLTGEHAIRNKAQILKGDAPLIISVDKPTLPKMLSKAGYTNAVIGKWHLGLGDGNVDWNKKVSPGPLEIGFVAEKTHNTGALGISLIGGAGMFAVSSWQPLIGRWIDTAKQQANQVALNGSHPDLIAGQAVLLKLTIFPTILIVAFSLLWYVTSKSNTTTQKYKR